MSSPMDVGATLSEGWNVFTKNAVALIVGIVLVGLIGGFSMFLLMGPMLLGYYRMCLKAQAGESVEVGDVFSGFSDFVPAFVLSLLMGIIITIGLFFLVLPGIIAAYLFFWAFWFLADGEMNPIECLKKSAELQQKDLGGSIVFVLVNGLLQSVGSSTMIGVLLTGPLGSTMAASAFARATKD